MSNPTCPSCDCVAGCQADPVACPNLVELHQIKNEQPPTIAAYLTRNDDGDMLFFDKAEAQQYCDDDSEPEPLVLLSDIVQPEQKANCEECGGDGIVLASQTQWACQTCSESAIAQPEQTASPTCALCGHQYIKHSADDYCPQATTQPKAKP